MGEEWIGLTLAERGLLESVCRAIILFGPLPDDPRLVAKRIGTEVAEVKPAWPAVRRMLQPEESGRLTHAETAEALKAAQRAWDIAKETGAAGGRAKAEKGRKSANTVGPLQGPLQGPLVQTKTVDKETTTSRVAGKVVSISGEQPDENEPLVDAFQQFIDKYPNKIGVDAACRQWVGFVGAEITQQTLPEVMAGLQRWVDSQQWANESGRYIPAPAKWLLEKKWLDHPPASAEAKAEREPRKVSSRGTDPNSYWVPEWANRKDEPQQPTTAAPFALPAKAAA